MKARGLSGVRTIRVAILEDRATDAELMIRQLRDDGFDPEWTRSDDEQSFAGALDSRPDVILADFLLPRFDALAALRMVRERGLDTPFIIVSASLGDERAAECIREGVDDYLLKDRLARLGPAVTRVTERVRLERERQRAAEIQRETELRLRVAVDVADVATWEYEPANGAMHLSAEWKRHLGYRDDEFPDSFDHCVARIHPDDYDRTMAALAAAIEGRVVPMDQELRIRHKNGSYVWFHSRASVVFDSAGNPMRVIGCATDVTEQKAAEQSLRESAERLKALMDHANDGITVLTPEGIILDANLRMAEMLGTTREAMLGKRIADFGGMDEAAEAAFSAAVEVGRGRFHGAHLKKADGTAVIVDFSTAHVTLGGESLLLTIGRDMTEQRLLEQQFLQAQKMEAVGRLAGGVAHDFNNILTAILGYTELLRLDHQLEATALADLQEVEEAAKRAAALTGHLLAFSRRQVLQPAVLDPNALIADLEKMLRRLIGEDVHLNLRLSPQQGRIEVDPGQLHQVILNLVVNARDAMPAGGTLEIETAQVSLSPQVAGVRSAVRPGDYIAIRVRDTGTGMDATTMSRLFEPFFTTKERGKGTGLGLSTVFGIVHQSNGYIAVESEKDRGSLFTIYFPVTTNELEDRQAADQATSMLGTETVLLAEDDEQLRPLVRAMLERFGYVVLEAANAGEALQIASQHRGRIDLLVTDVVMPGASGHDLAVELRKARPDTCVLYISGYTPDTIMDHGVREGGTVLLRKPFTSSELGRRARQLLQERAPARLRHSVRVAGQI